MSLSPSTLTVKSNHSICCAVYVRNLVKRYKSGTVALKDLNMTVKKGAVYGLLGSSGCGKTTILSCIAGLQTWDAGELLVFGECPGMHLATQLGYMPQDVSLYGHLSIFENIQFYGRLYKLSDKQIQDKWNLLSSLLKLPNELKFIGNLSGGQKRRASLALALAHGPELLILDEPTVGLDPLIREKIWEYLTSIVKSKNTTIIITTHYMEEARFCDTIGIMRNGQIIAEETPAQLLARHDCDLLEEAVLSLCRAHETFVKGNPLGKTLEHNLVSSVKNSKAHCSNRDGKFACMLNGAGDNSYIRVNHAAVCLRTDYRVDLSDTVHHSFQKIYAFVVVMALTLTRHRVFSAILLFMPTIQCLLALATIGGRVKNLHFGVVNQDLEDFENDETALNHVKLGEMWGFMSIPANHSTHITDLVLQKYFSSNETLEGSRIRLRVDHSQSITAFFILKNLYKTYINYSKRLSEICGMSEAFNLPINDRPATYGDYTDNFTDFVLPGVLLMSTGSISVVLSALLFVTDYQQKTLSRAYVAGLKITDILCSHIIVQSVVIIAQTGLLTGILYFVFDYRIHGLESTLLYLLICLLTGVVAAPLGLLQGILCKDAVTTLIFGIFFTPLYLLWGGVCFPTETATWFWQQLGYIIPLKVPIAALRSVTIRGLGITHPMVWCVFVAWLIWMFCTVGGVVAIFRRLKL